MEKIKLLLYCTKQPHKLFNTDKGFVLSDFELGDYFKDKTLLNGKIVAECDYEVEEIREAGDEFGYYCYTENLLESELLKKSCLTEGQLYGYLENGTGYAIHIKNLNIFDKPKELSEYGTETSPIFMKPIAYAPQNMMRCIDAYDNQYILISIRPEWLCKILNGEKTIEVRKKVLKEMVK